MKTSNNPFSIVRIVFFLAFLTANLHTARPAEFVVINDTVTFTSSGTYGFYWRPKPYSDMPANWMSPNNFYNGQFYVRYEILSQPTNRESQLQFGIWQKHIPDTVPRKELMGPRLNLDGPGSVAVFNNAPSGWYKLNGTVDFSRVYDFVNIGLVLWSVDPVGYIAPPPPSSWNGNPDVWAVRNDFFPLTAAITVVAVSSGSTFSGWTNYLGHQPATPSYVIDYAQEKTTAVVPSGDEYSYTTGMSPAFNGTGQKLVITPGQDIYFRTRAEGLNPASEIQHLVVPSRPSAPSYGIDYINESTNGPVPATIEYSPNANFSAANSGTTSVIPVIPGETLYFRYKSTGSAFNSQVFTLNVPGRPSLPVVSIDFEAEKSNQVLPPSIEYAANPGLSGAITCSDEKVSFVPGTDLYFRTKASVGAFKSGVRHVVSPVRPASPQISIDYVNESTQEAIPSTMEWSLNGSMTTSVSGNSEVVDLTPGTDLYFRLKATGSNYASLPAMLDVPGRPANPAYTINYIAETTQQAIGTGVEYASLQDMSGSVSGNDMVLPLVPGNNIYFRKKATSASFRSGIQQLVVPERPDPPVFTINFGSEATSTTIPSTISYSYNSIFESALTGSGKTLKLTPGEDVYFRKPAGAANFRSDTTLLDVPQRITLVSESGDTVSKEFSVAIQTIDPEDSQSIDLSHFHVSNGLAFDLNALKFNVQPESKGFVPVYLPANVLPRGNFISNHLNIYYTDPPTTLDPVEENGIKIYPNPVNNSPVYITLPDFDGFTDIRIYSAEGKLLYNRVIADQSLLRIETAELNPGVYIVRIAAENGIFSEKIIIQ
jgi:hypothetical protein